MSEIDYELFKRAVVALEVIAKSLEKLSKCVDSEINAVQVTENAPV
jgi:hypothetical protein